MLTVIGCGKKIDPQKPFGMYLNGRENNPLFKDPEAFLHDIEDGTGYTGSKQRGLIIFPLPLPSGPMPRGGIEISFDPKNIPAGQNIQISQSESASGINIYYFPMQIGAGNSGKVYTFGLRPSKGGAATIRFDLLEAKVGGKIKGVILDAVMDAYFKTEDGTTEELTKPQELKLFNWSFETTFKEHPFLSM